MRHLARVHPASPHGPAGNGDEIARFCTHCAALLDEGDRRRVCPECGLGMVLSCAAELLPASGAAFLVVTANLRVSAASENAERLLAIPDGTYGRPLLSLLTSPEGAGELSRRVVRAAATGAYAVSTIPVQAASGVLAGREVDARIGGCGSPPAALVVVGAGGT